MSTVLVANIVLVEPHHDLSIPILSLPRELSRGTLSTLSRLAEGNDHTPEQSPLLRSGIIEADKRKKKLVLATYDLRSLTMLLSPAGVARSVQMRHRVPLHLGNLWKHTYLQGV